MTPESSTSQAILDVQQWLVKVVIGLNLCPFAAKPNRLNQIRFSLFEGQDEDTLLQLIKDELLLLDNSTVDALETTLIITPQMLADFHEYNQFLDYADFVLQRGGWEGIYQIASFHPHYCFADSHEDDDSNLTNRSPYPIFHLIREASLEQAIAKYPNVESIPDTNIRRVESLTEAEKKQLFPYLFTDAF